MKPYLASLGLLTLLVAFLCASLVSTAASTAADPTPEGGAVALALVPAWSGVSHPVFFGHAGDGSNRAYVVGARGIIYLISNGVVQSTPFLDISPTFGPSPVGLLALAFHPQYKDNGYFYVHYTNTNYTIIARYTANAARTQADPASAQVILQLDRPPYDHVGGMLAFGPDGYLYITIGEGEGPGSPRLNAQNPGLLLGKILRLDVNSTTQPYVVPPTNPFVGNAAYRPEIWGLGLRNPWRHTFDRATGDLYIADVGEDHWEEINFQAAGSAGGQNYGWSRMEGLHCLGASGCTRVA
jgi:glucose/arabinose dehydrogenase